MDNSPRVTILFDVNKKNSGDPRTCHHFALNVGFKGIVLPLSQDTTLKFIHYEATAKR